MEKLDEEECKNLVGRKRKYSDFQTVTKAIDKDDLNPVEKAFFLRPNSPSFRIFADK